MRLNLIEYHGDLLCIVNPLTHLSNFGLIWRRQSSLAFALGLGLAVLWLFSRALPFARAAGPRYVDPTWDGYASTGNLDVHHLRHTFASGDETTSAIIGGANILGT